MAPVTPVASAVIVDAVRTPLGRRLGLLRDWHPVDLAAEVLRALVTRNDLDPAAVDDVIFGCFSQVGEQALNVARSAALAAGFPESVPGHHRRPPVRVVAAGHPLRGPGGDGRRLRRGDRGRGGVDEPGADGLGHPQRAGPALRPHRPPALPAGGGPRPPGDRGRAHRRGVGPVPGRPRRLQPGQPPAGGGGHRRGPVRPGDRARPGRLHPGQGRDARRRGHPPRHQPGGAGRAQARLRERGPDHGRQLVPDHRRGGRGPDHERGPGRRPRASRPGPAWPRSRWSASTPS